MSIKHGVTERCSNSGLIKTLSKKYTLTMTPLYHKNEDDSTQES